MATDEFLTIDSQAEGFYKEKGSKFIAIAVHVSSAEEVKSELGRLRKQYHDARHHCYAYRIGPEPYEFRQNDDGEPSGTAGKPIYGQIQSSSLTNVLIVVVRYFGGVKLGTGGLTKAYKTAARDALNNGIIKTQTWNANMKIRFDYVNMDMVMRILRDEGVRIISQESNEKCSICLEVRKGNFESLKQKLSSHEMLDIIVI